MQHGEVKIFAELNEILFPARCIGCSELGPALCQLCKRSWSPTIYHQNLSKRYRGIGDTRPDLSVFSSVEYSPIAKRVLLAAKENHIREADALLISALEYSMRAHFRHPLLPTITGLVPIPSRARVIRVRGRDFLTEISQELGSQYQTPNFSILGYSRVVKDQSKLNTEERWSNLNGAFLAKSHSAQGVDTKSLQGATVLLVDDLVTTGATLLEAERALNYAGIRVAGAVTACIAQPLR